MRYIRTEDGRIVNKNKTICYAFREDYISPNWNDDIEKYLQTKIIAESDTIEELCDEFVFEILSGEDEELMYRDVVNSKRDIKAQIKIYDELMSGVRAIYGAIWTDKGLIYKVKMKGILPNGEIDWELL